MPYTLTCAVEGLRARCQHSIPPFLLTQTHCVRPSGLLQTRHEKGKPVISRCEVIQSLLNQYVLPKSLEVGVNKGETFHALLAETKVAVDPKFQFRPPSPSPIG